MYHIQSPLISIIIPVYQVEKYLDKCVASIINQTYTNLEIILVDDGSPDNCPTICDAWKERDSRIKVIHQENGGLSHARNEGLKIATGEFIGFVDSDDWIESNMYELLLSVLLKTDADIAVCNCYGNAKSSKNLQVNKQLLEQKQYSSEEILEIHLKREGLIHNYVWNKLFRKSIISNITFSEGKLYEDILWTTRVIGNSKRIVYINDYLYHYIYRSESLSHNIKNVVKRLNDELEMIEQRLEYLQENFPELNKWTIFNFQNFCLGKYLEFNQDYRDIDVDGKIRCTLHGHFNKYLPVIVFNVANIKMNLTRILFWISPSVLLKSRKFISVIKSKKS